MFASFRVALLSIPVLFFFIPLTVVAQSSLTLETRGVTPISPPVPRILRDVATVDKEGTNYSAPTIPAYKTSIDGRIGINPKAPGGKLWFNLLRPEETANSLPDLPFGPQLLAYKQTHLQPSIPSSSSHRSSYPVTVIHSTLCEESTNNPQPLNGRDVYSFVLLSGTREQSPANGQTPRFRFWSTPLSITVSNPKTPTASISSIDLGTPQAGPYLPVRNFFEPLVSEDGKLLFGRVGNALLEKTGEYSGRYNIVYSVAPRGAAACDLAEWDELRPLAFMPYDSEMKGRYDIATYPFRDTEGNLIPKDINIPASYPWMDRKAKNVFLHVDSSTLYFKHASRMHSRYEARCLDETNCNWNPSAVADVEAGGQTRGLSVLGLWTHGKLVTIDGILNNTDYGLRIPRTMQRELKLYQKAGGYEWVRVAAGRDNSTTLPAGVVNTSFIDSFENAFNMHRYMRPTTPRDVGWIMSHGNSTDEVVFDDYQDIDLLIFSEMNASWTHDGVVHNGFEEVSAGDLQFTQSGSNSSIRIQNAATSPFLEIPDAGTLYGHGRIEPVALGGVRGKGLFLHRYSRLGYDIPSGLDTRNWYFGMFLDLRNNDLQTRNLFSIGNGASVLYDETSHELVLYSGFHNTELGRFQIPADYLDSGWNHFGFYFWDRGAAVNFFIDGMRVGTITLNHNHFRLSPGEFLIGRNPAHSFQGVRGWIDDVRLNVSRHVNYEEYCNYARGTLIRMEQETTANSKWWRRALHTSDFIHANKIGNGDYDGEFPPRYACLINYTGDNLVSALNVPQGSFSARDEILFPEGPLAFNETRPDSSANQFCLSCHTNRDTGVSSGLERPASLAIEALEAGSGEFRLDNRRQPLDSPRSIYGVVPAGWVEAADTVARPTQSREFSTHAGNSTFWVHPSQN